MSHTVGRDLARAAELLQHGGLVAFATETVYGLGANALDARAVARVFEAKDRPEFDPLIVHIAAIDWLPRVAAAFPEPARRLAEAFWPGPLSLVVPKRAEIPDIVTAGLPTVAVRIPAHPLARELIETAGVPVAAPSANPFGRTSPTCAEHVAEQLGEKVDYILDGGPCAVGIESTIVFFEAERAAPTDYRCRLLRHGGIPLEEIERRIGHVETVADADQPVLEAQQAPGMLPRHYAPRTPLQLVTQVPSTLPRGRVGLLLACLPSDSRPGTDEDTLSTVPGYSAVEILSSSGELAECAANFFAALRRLDARDLDRIIAVQFPEEGLGRALNDRLRRAAQPLEDR